MVAYSSTEAVEAAIRHCARDDAIKPTRDSLRLLPFRKTKGPSYILLSICRVGEGCRTNETCRWKRLATRLIRDADSSTSHQCG